MIFVSYHNIDIEYAFQLSDLLIRYYRNVWLDRFEISPSEDWNDETRQAYARATGVLVIVSDDYLETQYCRTEYEYFRSRHIPVTAVIPRDFSTDKIADFAFDDWIDFRRWFDEPNELSVENLLGQIPQSETVQHSGERSDYLRRFIANTELALSKLPTAWTALRNSAGQSSQQRRPRAFPAQILQDWEFAVVQDKTTGQIQDLLDWADSEARFIFAGEAGSGKRMFARLLGLEYAHRGLRDDRAPLPVWLDLVLWDREYQTLGAYIESQWTLISYWKHWLQGNRAAFFLDNWNDLATLQPAFASELSAWIGANDKHQFVLLSSYPTASDPPLPQLSINPISAQLALRFGAACLSLEQLTNFRNILKNQQSIIQSNPLDYLAIGIELLATDTSLAVNEWQTNPIPALISGRYQQLHNSSREIHRSQVIAYLQGLAWRMMQGANPRFIARDEAEESANDRAIIDISIALGVLTGSGKFLRFTVETYKWYLASAHFAVDELYKYLTVPQFSVSGGRTPQKWDSLVSILVDDTAGAARERVLNQIIEIDPFLANRCLQRHPALYESSYDTLVGKLVQLASRNASAQVPFRACLRSMPDRKKALEALVSQMSQFDNRTQVWLWREVVALPIDMPAAFIEQVAHVNRSSPVPVVDLYSEYRLPTAISYLVKLTENQDAQVRANAVWILGEIKYLPTAVLLLDNLEKKAAGDLDEIVLALMKFAYSDILVRLLRWSQDNPDHFETVVTAFETRGRFVSARMLSLSQKGQMTLNPQFFDLLVDHDELDLAIGLAQIAEAYVELPETVEISISSKQNADKLRDLVGKCIKHLPNSEHFAALLDDVLAVLRDPPESTVIAGSSLGALLYGQPLFDDLSAQAELPDELLPPDDGIPDNLVEQLHHDDWQQRHSALTKLIDFPVEAALPHLLDVTNDRETVVRLAAYDTLWRLSDELAARKALVAALSDPDREVVMTVADLLKSVTNLAYDDLLELLESENALAVAAVSDILQDADYQPAVAALSRLLDDSRIPGGMSSSIGELAAGAIASIEKRIASASLTDQKPIKERAIPGQSTGETTSTFSDEEKVLRTLELLRDDDWGRTQKAAKFLRKFAKHLRDIDNDNILRLLSSALEDENWHVRWAVAEALAWLRNPAAKRYLYKALDDPSWIVQVAVIRALVALGAGESVQRLIPSLRSEHKAVREAAAEALGELRNQAAINSLGETFRNDDDSFVRLAALRAMQQINPSLAREHMEFALDDRFIHIRWYAVNALAPEMDSSALDTLARLLHDDGKPSWEEDSIRDIAAKALQRIDTPESRAILDAAQALENRTRA